MLLRVIITSGLLRGLAVLGVLGILEVLMLEVGPDVIITLLESSSFLISSRACRALGGRFIDSQIDDKVFGYSMNLKCESIGWGFFILYNSDAISNI